MILREAFDYEFSRLDPFAAHIDPPSVAVYETLLAKGPDWKPHPMLAEAWQISDDGLEWRIRLRPGLHFHSGAPCDAEAVVAALTRLRWENAGDDQLWYWDPVDTVRADSSDTLVFTLHYPYVRLPALLWGTHTAIFNDAVRNREGDAFGKTVADGTGPFRLTSWSPEHVSAEAWPAYPGTPVSFMTNAGPARLDGIEWISILDENERLAALERGDVHCLHRPPLHEIERLRAEPDLNVIEYGQASNVYLGLDWRRTEFGFNDVRMRRAVSLGIDRESLVADCLAGHGVPTYGPVPPGDKFYEPEVDAGLGYELSHATALLDEAGWHVGDVGIRERDGRRLSFECVCQDDSVLRRIGWQVQAQLAKLGIELKLRFEKPFRAFYEACAAGPASFISKWLWQDPIDALIGFSATRGQPFPNWQHSSVPALDRLFQTWLRAETDEELYHAASRAQHIFAEQLPYVPILTPNDVWVHINRLHRWRPYPANLYPFYHHVWLET